MGADENLRVVLKRVAEKQRQLMLPTHNSLLDVDGFLSELESTP